MGFLAQVQSNFGWIDAIVIVLYLAALTGVGVYFSRRQSNLDEYFRAGQSMGWLPVGLSLMAALNSGADYMTQPSAAIKYGLIYTPSLLTWIIAYYYVGYLILPFYRRLNIFSVYQFLERRFDLRVRGLAAAIFILWRLGWMGTALFIPCLAVNAASGGKVPLIPMVLILGVLVTTYTALGGIKGVIWTDVIQFCVMIFGLIVTVAVVVYNVEGGFGHILATANQHDKLTMGMDLPGFNAAGVPGKADPTLLDRIYLFLTAPPTGITIFIAILVSRFAAFTGDQMTVQRFQTARSIKDEKPAFIINAMGDVIWMIGLAFVGLALFAYYRAHALPGTVKEDDILPYFMSQVFPVGVTGLVIAAIIAASLSSVDSAINSSTTVAVVDFYNRLYLGREVGQATLSEAEQRQQIRVSRIITFAIGAIGTTLACFVRQIGDLVTIGVAVVSSFAGPLLGIYLLGIFTRRARSTGVLVGGLIGGALTYFVAFHTELKLWAALCGLVTTVVAAYLISLAMGQNDESLASSRLTYYDLKGREDEAAATRAET